MWVGILLGLAFLVNTPSVRLWMVVIAASITIAVMFRAWMDTRRA
jgi:hypothetical protein